MQLAAIRRAGQTVLESGELDCGANGLRESLESGAVSVLDGQSEAEPSTTAADAAATRKAGLRFAEHLRPGDLIILSGELGAGKTTFTQGLAEGLGVRGPITSPTFVLARVHPSLVGGPALVHVDAYRRRGSSR